MQILKINMFMFADFSFHSFQFHMTTDQNKLKKISSV